MKTRYGWPLGVCSWSLQKKLSEVAAWLKRVGVRHVHLAVGPALGPEGEAYLETARAQTWTITSAMIDFPQEDYSSLDAIRRTGGIVPDEVWPANRERFGRAAEVAASLGAPFLSMHAGFLDPSDAAGERVFADRIRTLADTAGERGLTLLLETGQERAADLRHFLETLNHPALGINFDPANMILYDKDQPVDALRLLSPWIRHVHIKDAIRTQTPGVWGVEARWGDGQVGGAAFLDALAEIGYQGALAIEREAGTARQDDIVQALRRLVR